MRGMIVALGVSQNHIVQGLDIGAFVFELMEAKSNMCMDDGPSLVE
jgi:hypothetical protein